MFLFSSFKLLIKNNKKKKNNYYASVTIINIIYMRTRAIVRKGKTSGFSCKCERKKEREREKETNFWNNWREKSLFFFSLSLSLILSTQVLSALFLLVIVAQRSTIFSDCCQKTLSLLFTIVITLCISYNIIFFI